MKLNQFLHLMSSIEEVMENDDVDIVVVGKDSGGGRIGDSDLKFNHINDIQFDRENKQIQIYYHNFNVVS
ncbi:MAG: hypothetical protein EVA26_02740 [Burkholderiaceae bacterium]|nr:MAG: hypothetical protein EVA26_02740 [Burkholderiaceae bacterium]